MKNCKEFKQMLSAYADGELSDEEKKTIDRHIENCTECKKALNEQMELHAKLTTLANTPALPNENGLIMAAITGNTTHKSRRWLRPVLIATPVVLILAILLTLLLLNMALTPEKVLAKAQAAISNVQSYRAYVYSTPSVIQSLLEFAGDRFRDVRYGDDRERIFIREQIYLRGYDFTGLSIDDMQAGTPSAKMTQKQLNMLTTIEVLPEESINGVACFHYRGPVDNEQYFKNYLKPSLEKATYDNFIKINENREKKFTEEEIIKFVKQLIVSAAEKHKEKNSEMIWEFWIGKNDYIMRQWKDITDGVPWTVKYFDFNVPISIEPPLDAEGNLLPGWTSMTERSYPDFSQ